MNGNSPKIVIEGRKIGTGHPCFGIAESALPAVPRGRVAPEDSRLDPRMSIADQFELLRVVDNVRYPSFFDLRGHRYLVTTKKINEKKSS